MAKRHWLDPLARQLLRATGQIPAASRPGLLRPVARDVHARGDQLGLQRLCLHRVQTEVGRGEVLLQGFVRQKRPVAHQTQHLAELVHL